MGGSAPKEIVEMRWQHLEHKRKRKLEMLLNERHRILKEEQQGRVSFMNGNPSYYGTAQGVATNPQDAYLVNYTTISSSPDRLISRSMRVRMERDNHRLTKVR